MVRWAIGFFGVVRSWPPSSHSSGVARNLAFVSKWLFVACLVLTGFSLFRGPRVVG